MLLCRNCGPELCCSLRWRFRGHHWCGAVMAMLISWMIGDSLDVAEGNELLAVSRTDSVQCWMCVVAWCIRNLRSLGSLVS